MFKRYLINMQNIVMLIIAIIGNIIYWIFMNDLMLEIIALVIDLIWLSFMLYDSYQNYKYIKSLEKFYSLPKIV